MTDVKLPAFGELVPTKRANSQTPRRLLILVILAGLVVFSSLLSLRVGSVSVPWHDAIGALFNYHGVAHSPYDEVVVRTLRVPRTVAGLGIGVALGVTGTLMQGLTRNPLADPGILGINAGASLAVTLCALIGVDSFGEYVWFAFAGATLLAAIGYTLGSLGGGATPLKLALAGAILSSFVGSIISAIDELFPNVILLTRFAAIGSVAGVPLSNFFQAVPFLVVGLLIALGTGKALNAFALGDEVAKSLGQRLALTRGLVAAAVVLLAGTATALAGPIAFLGLMVPHAARWLVGPDYRWIVPTSILLGPVVLLLCDVAGRVVAEPGEVAVGIMVAVLGGPFFVVLARRKHLEGGL